ncbi:MAG: KH domain-containing protein [Verrucomicrobia bacterium]|nr:KH domain-containing protein [Verrucomicrobiota bacterium]
MQAWLEYVVKGLVDYPEAVTVTPVDQNGVTLYELRLHPRDVGKVIGRQGATIHALRSLLLVGSAKQGLRCTVDIVEDRASPGPAEGS